MKIASWNVNGLRARIENVVRWLDDVSPDIVCLQETKCADDVFPREAIEQAGYNIAVHGQKGFNGVAILSKTPLEDVALGFGDDSDDTQARYIESVISCASGAVRVASLYVPNGNPVESEKFLYKLSWMEDFADHVKDLLSHEERFVLAGDYNIIPSAADAARPEAWEDDALFHPRSLARYRSIMTLGLTDAFRACSNADDAYTFWDYQGGAWRKNDGIRIDHLLLSPQASDCLIRCEIDRRPRDWEKPSDHTPIWLALDVGDEDAKDTDSGDKESANKDESDI